MKEADHKKAIQRLQGQIEGIQAKVEELRAGMATVQAAKESAIEEAAEGGQMPNAKSENKQLYELREEIADGERVLGKLRAKLDAELEGYKQHLLESVELEREKYEKGAALHVQQIHEAERLLYSLTVEWAGRTPEGQIVKPEVLKTMGLGSLKIGLWLEKQRAIEALEKSTKSLSQSELLQRALA